MVRQSYNLGGMFFSSKQAVLEYAKAIKDNASPGEIELIKQLPSDTVFFHGGDMFVNHPANEARDITGIECNGRTKYRVNQNYAIVPKRGLASVGRYQLVSIRRQPLRAISEADAIAEGLWRNDAGLYTTSVLAGEGFNTAREGYEALWRAINTSAPYRWQDNPDVWVFTLKVLQFEAVRT